MINKKAQASRLGIGLAVILAIFIFLVGMININFIKDEVTRARNAANLNCSDDSISDGTKLTCLAVDIVVPYFIILILSASGGLIIAKFVV